jgi:hypothetical protein
MQLMGASVGKLTNRSSTSILAALATFVVLVAAAGAVWYFVSASRSPDTFVLYFDNPATAVQVRSLQARVARLQGVTSVEYLGSTPVLGAFKLDAQAHPDSLVDQVDGPTIVGGLKVTMRRPWNLLASRRVVRMLELDSTFPSVERSWAPPGGW